MFDEEQDIDLKYHQVEPTQTLIDTGVKIDPQLGVYGFKPLREPSMETFINNDGQEVDDSLFFEEILKPSLDGKTQTDGMVKSLVSLPDSVNLNQKDLLYKQALAEVLKTRKASASFLKRQLKISFSEASEIINRMEAEGLIGPDNG